jgi:uncharacterized protein (TIGR00251 family)
MRINLTSRGDGVLLTVRVQPGARTTAVLGDHGNALKVAVTAPPEGGRANQAVLELLRCWLGLKRSQVELHSGATNRTKTVLIRGVTIAELTALVTAKLG